MYYEINIALNGDHFIATAPRSIVTPSKLARVYRELVNKFPSSEGYNIFVTRYENSGYSVNMDDILMEY